MLLSVFSNPNPQTIIWQKKKIPILSQTMCFLLTKCFGKKWLYWSFHVWKEIKKRWLHWASAVGWECEKHQFPLWHHKGTIFKILYFRKQPRMDFFISWKLIDRLVKCVAVRKLHKMENLRFSFSRSSKQGSKILYWHQQRISQFVRAY